MPTPYRSSASHVLLNSLCVMRTACALRRLSISGRCGDVNIPPFLAWLRVAIGTARRPGRPRRSSRDDPPSGGGALTGVQPVDTAERRQLTQVLDGAAQVVADIARWNGTTAARIGRANLVYVQAATLTGGQVTDNAALNGPTGQQGSGRRQTHLRQAVRNEVPNAGASWA